MMTAKKPDIIMAVTGGESFVLRKLYPLLPGMDQVKKVIVFDIQPPLVDDPKVEYYEMDLTLPESRGEMARVMKKARVNTFIHSAFLWNPVRDRDWAHEVEAVGTEYAISACVEAGISKFILTSSTLLYGALPNNPLLLKEEHPLNVHKFPNLKDKARAETTVASIAAKYREMRVIILRSAMVMGPTVDSYIASILARPVVPVLLGYDPLVQFLHEEDFIRAYLLALTGDFSGVFNIVPNAALPLSMVLKIGGRRRLFLPNLISKNLIQAMYASDFSDFPPSYMDYLRFSVVADGKKAEKVLKFKAKYSTAQTAADFYDALEGRD